MSTNYTNTVENLIQGVLNHGPDILDNVLIDDYSKIENYLNKITAEHLDYPIPKTSVDFDCWFIPEEYKTMDIEQFLVNLCPEENYQRLELEIDLFKKHNMLNVLKTIKYIVDTLRSNKIVWGVGRGSSVASYALYLIGAHKIDSIKYKLPIEEFFKGDQNG